MTRCLVTGFEPFGCWTRNPSGELADCLPRTLESRPFSTHGMILPVSWTDSVLSLRQAILSYNPDVLVLLGVATSAECRIELVAKNTAAPVADNAGLFPSTDALYRIAPDKPAALFTRLPVRALIDPPPATDHITEPPRIRTIPSFDAGAYLCNFVFFHALSEFQHISCCGFIHVPPLADENPTVGAEFSVLTEVIAQHVSTIVDEFEHLHAASNSNGVYSTASNTDRNDSLSDGTSPASAAKC